MENTGINILVAEDEDTNREILSHILSHQGHVVSAVEDGIKALTQISSQKFDLVLLDIEMPGMDGYDVLRQIKNDPKTSQIPVIMISAIHEIDTIVRCIDMGAEDYLEKPFDPLILKARISACIEKLWFRDQERQYFKELQNEREKGEKLLLNILPRPIAERLKQGESRIANYFPDVTIMFTDIAKFSKMTARMTSEELVAFLNSIFSEFDHLAQKYGLEKIKTIGDSYMIAGGLPNPRPDHAETMAEMALNILRVKKRFHVTGHKNVSIRVGISTGPVQAGIIGTQKFSYDLWGDTVNIASRMQSHGIPDQIQVSESTYRRLKDKFLFKKRGFIRVKGKGWMSTYLLKDKKAGL